jgi:hypothetical protein
MALCVNVDLLPFSFFFLLILLCVCVCVCVWGGGGGEEGLSHFYNILNIIRHSTTLNYLGRDWNYNNRCIIGTLLRNLNYATCQSQRRSRILLRIVLSALCSIVSLPVYWEPLSIHSICLRLLACQQQRPEKSSMNFELYSLL